MKKYMLILVLISFCSFLGCKNDDYSIDISGKTTVMEGEQIQLKVETNLKKYIASWYSNNETIATVNKYGIVTGINKGTCEILLSIGNKTTQIKINVEKFDIDISGENSLIVGEISKLKVSYNSTNNKNIFFTSENEEIASVDNYGNIKAISKGKTNIIVNVAGFEKVYTIIVKNALVAPLTVEVPEHIKLDELVKVSANREVYWYSSDESILYVDENDELVICGTGVVVLRAIDVNDSNTFIDTTIIID